MIERPEGFIEPEFAYLGDVHDRYYGESVSHGVYCCSHCGGVVRDTTLHVEWHVALATILTSLGG